MSFTSVTVDLTRPKSSSFTFATPEKLSCVFEYIWRKDYNNGRAYISTINDEPFGTALDDGSGNKTFAGTPTWVQNQGMNGISFEIDKFVLKIATNGAAEAAVWTKSQTTSTAPLYKSKNYR